MVVEMHGKMNRNFMAMGMVLLCLSGVFTGCRGKVSSEDAGQNTQAESQAVLDESTDGQDAEKEETEALSESGTSKNGGSESQDSESGGSGGNASEDASDEHEDTPMLPNATGWAIQKYTDEYLSYEIPENWGKNEDESNRMMMFAFFQSQSPEVEYPSNVNVQITQLDTGNQPMSIDYGEEDIQEEFHQFMLSDMGLPAEAAKGTFSVTQTAKGIYVYSLGFERKAMDNTMVHQTIYLPMNLQHSIVIWATDFQDGAKVSADEAARHICETLEIVQ